MSEFLEKMIVASRRRAARSRQKHSEVVLRRRALETASPPKLALSPHGFDLIAEFKRRTPSRGVLFDGDAWSSACVTGRVRGYAAAGAAAVSVLTEPDVFHGSLADLRQAARAAPVPVMRKDFLVDPYQVVEARASGASGVLLILRIVEDARLVEMLDAAREMRLFVLLEAFDDEDLLRADALRRVGRLEADALVGLNCRDLCTLQTDSTRFRRLRPAFPTTTPLVAESGLSAAEDVSCVAGLGYRMALVGTALIRAQDPGRLIREMIAAGRQEVTVKCKSG